MSIPLLRLREWDCGPKADSQLAGYVLEDDNQRRQAQALSDSGALEILELRQGLRVCSNSHVGSVSLGNLRIIIEPKISGSLRPSLVRYAYRLRDLKLYSAVEHDTGPSAFQDLLIMQLLAEADDLLDRGLHRKYERQAEALASPRGRIDFGRLALQGGMAKAALPCVHHPRLENCLVNQVLLGGLRRAETLTDDLPFRARLRGSAALIETQVSPVGPDRATLARLHREMDRLTASYRPAMTLVELLAASMGVDLEAERKAPPVPGFLFDMNRFFQALLSRFLHENLAGWEVLDEHRLKGMLGYVQDYNPRRRRAPAPRPDFVIRHEGRTVAMLDAKYRDLWETSLPDQMLYQLTMYALSHEARGVATILYPTSGREATEARVEIRDPVSERQRAVVILRPVMLDRIAELVSAPPGARRERERAAFAKKLAFGDGMLAAERASTGSGVG